jgi:hypothetical protein
MKRFAYGKNTSAIMFDTGSIEFHEDLRIGAKRESRVTMRRVTTCSLLRLKKYLQLDFIDFGRLEDRMKITIDPTKEESKHTYWHNRRRIMMVKNYHVE